MTITKHFENGTLTLTLEGRLDSNTAPKLENVLSNALDGVSELVIDMSEIEYFSSAGLRVMLFTRKRMDDRGRMTVCHVQKAVQEVFDISGISSVITVEP